MTCEKSGSLIISEVNNFATEMFLKVSVHLKNKILSTFQLSVIQCMFDHIYNFFSKTFVH